jgi:ribonuclease E
MSDEAIDLRAESSRDAAEEGGGAGEQESGERKRRRSRRRRGGRGRKTGDSQDARRPAGRGRRDPELLETPGADDFDDDFEDLPVGDSDEADVDSGPAFDDDEEDAGDELNGDATPARGRSAGHRSIPSWEEAIGFIVETNMQSRSQRRPAGGSGQRGRPRGGRRRRKPS